jgi:excisionase family DNA binding protein
MDTDIMTIREVAEYLKLAEKTAYHLAAKGTIPGFKVGGAWRIRRSEIDKSIGRQFGKQDEGRRNVGSNSQGSELKFFRLVDRRNSSRIVSQQVV